MKVTIGGAGKVELYHDRICITSEKTRAFVSGNASEGKISVRLEPEDTGGKFNFAGCTFKGVNVVSGNIDAAVAIVNGGKFRFDGCTVNAVHIGDGYGALPVNNISQRRGGRVVVNGVEIGSAEERGFEFGTTKGKDACFRFDRETVPIEKLKTKTLARVIVDHSVLLSLVHGISFNVSTNSAIVIASEGTRSIVGGTTRINARTHGKFDGLGMIDFKRLDAKASTHGSISGLRICREGDLKSSTHGRISVCATNAAKIRAKDRTYGTTCVRRDE